MINLAWLIPALPMAAFAVIGLFTRRSKALSVLLSLAAIAVAMVLSYGILFEVMAGARSNVGFRWVELGDRDLTFGWQVDQLTAIMLVVVTTISFLVQVFSWGYMTEPATDPHGHTTGEAHGGQVRMVHDPGLSRFYAYLSLFSAAMLGLVLANNLLTIYIFWEGVGLGSYLLIGFWYAGAPGATDPSHPPAHEPEPLLPVDARPSPSTAAIKAFVTTRIGDFGMLIGILILWTYAGTLDFARLSEMAHNHQIDQNALTVAAILLFTGAIGKSAQFPLHVWLPDAMEGPTPVSALIHAATMVAAGVYLVARSFVLFEEAPTAMFVVAAIGGFTAIFAATMGAVADDLKRVMAYSTVSQLGYMMLALGTGSLAAGIFHLFTHAFFKALLFLTAGSVIHAVHSQRISQMGGLFRALPITGIAMLAAALSLAGFPLTSGFWSKDAVLGATAAKAAGDPRYTILLAFALITVFLTAFYMFRAFFRTFFGQFRGEHYPDHKEGLSALTLPLLILIVPSLLVGLWGSPIFGEGFQAFLEPGHHEAINTTMMILSVVLALAGIALAYLMYVVGAISPRAVTSALRPLYTLAANKYYLDDLYMWLIDRIVLGWSRLLAFFVDPKIIDGIVNGIGRLTVVGSAAARQIQTGRLQFYAMFVFGGLFVISLLTIILRPR